MNIKTKTFSNIKKVFSLFFCFTIIICMLSACTESKDVSKRKKSDSKTILGKWYNEKGDCLEILSDNTYSINKIYTGYELGIDSGKWEYLKEEEFFKFYANNYDESVIRVELNEDKYGTYIEYTYYGVFYKNEFPLKLIEEQNKAEKEPDVSYDTFEEFAVVDEDYKTFNTVTIKNKNGEFKFVAEKIDGLDENGKPTTTTYWTVGGIKVEKLGSAVINDIIKATANVIAMRSIDTKTPSECGFDDPRYKITVTLDNKDPYTLIIGDAAIGGFGGSYMMLEGKDEIYVVWDENFNKFDFKLTDLSDRAVIPITTFPSDTSDNKTADGTYAYFDSLTISGKLFPETITIVNNKEKSDTAELLPYLISTPTKRYANNEKLNSLVDLFSNPHIVEGNYAFDIDTKSLKSFGLDKPDAIITMTIDGTPRTFKFAIVDDTYSAVVYDGATMIRKVATKNFAFLSFKPEDLYYKNLFMNSINDIKVLKFNDADGNIKFDISYTENSDAGKTYHIKANDKEIVASHFQDFYANFVSIQCCDFTVDNINAKPDCTVTFVFKNNSETVIKLYRTNANKYQYTINDIAIGKITSSDYQEIVNSIKNIAAGKEP